MTNQTCNPQLIAKAEKIINDLNDVTKMLKDYHEKRKLALAVIRAKYTEFVDLLPAKKHKKLHKKGAKAEDATDFILIILKLFMRKKMVKTIIESKLFSKAIAFLELLSTEAKDDGLTSPDGILVSDALDELIKNISSVVSSHLI